MSGIDELDALVEGRHHNPHGILGLHGSDKSWTIRVLRPGALSVSGSAPRKKFEFTHIHRGVWEVSGKGKSPDSYRVTSWYESGEWTAADGYAFPPSIGELDLHLIAEGRHEE
ncbi:MAG: 1,4-alpha-glucan branching enzyme, partial [Aquiluna sp.]